MLDEPSAGFEPRGNASAHGGDPAPERRRARDPAGVARHGADVTVAEDVHVLASARSSPGATWRRSAGPERARSVSGDVTVLEVHSLVAGYGALTVLHDISLSIGDREAVAIVGANGAGKTTLVRAICGLLRARSGYILKDGVDISRTPPHELVQHRMAVVLENRPPVRRADRGGESPARGPSRPPATAGSCSTGATSTRSSR